MILFALVLTVSGAGAGTPADGEIPKIAEIARVISLGNIQKTLLKEAYVKYKAACDSALYKVEDIRESVALVYNTKKEFHKTMMKILTERQIIRYVNIAYAPEIEAKTDYKMSLLAEGNEYTDIEKETMRKEIYKYLMLEKVVYFRDKYDYAKQKNNISRLKVLQPDALKESNNREKQKGLGRLIQGKIKW